MNQSVRVALRYVASIHHLHPAASDADSLIVSNVAVVSCSLQIRGQFLKSRWKKIVMQRCIFEIIVQTGLGNLLPFIASVFLYVY